MSKILHNDEIFEEYEYEYEKEFEKDIVDHFKEVFGNESIYIDVKKKLNNKNIITIPDGYLIDFSFSDSPRLYIIENELVKHDPFRHIGQQLLKFAISYKSSGRKLKKFLLDDILKDEAKKDFVEGKILEAGYRNIDAFIDDLIFDNPVSSIVVIDEITDDLENVLSQLTMDTDIIEFKTYQNEDSRIHFFTPFQQDIRDTKGSNENEVNVENLDTIVVPANEEGFHNVFLGENCWYKVRISTSMIGRIKYIAGYQTAPISAITHYAEVSNIEKYKDTNKYIIKFKEPAKKINSINLPDEYHGFVPYSPRYTTFEKIKSAKNLEDVF